MKKKNKIVVGSRVKNIATEEIGIVIAIIGNEANPFGYIVQTSKGECRWILRKDSRKTNSKLS